MKTPDSIEAILEKGDYELYLFCEPGVLVLVLGIYLSFQGIIAGAGLILFAAMLYAVGHYTWFRSRVVVYRTMTRDQDVSLWYVFSCAIYAELKRHHRPIQTWIYNVRRQTTK